MIGRQQYFLHLHFFDTLNPFRNERAHFYNKGELDYGKMAVSTNRHSRVLRGHDNTGCLPS